MRCHRPDVAVDDRSGQVPPDPRLLHRNLRRHADSVGGLSNGCQRSLGDAVQGGLQQGTARQRQPVQEIAGGVATVLCGSSITKSGPATGDLINATTLGVVDDPTVKECVPASLGIALDPPNPATLIRIFCLCSPGLG